MYQGTFKAQFPSLGFWGTKTEYACIKEQARHNFHPLGFVFRIAYHYIDLNGSLNVLYLHCMKVYEIEGLFCFSCFEFYMHPRSACTLVICRLFCFFFFSQCMGQ